MSQTDISPIALGIPSNPVKQPIAVPAEIYALLESIAELPGPCWHEVTHLMQDPQAAYAAVVHASPLITGELARLVLGNGLIKPKNSNLN